MTQAAALPPLLRVEGLTVRFPRRAARRFGRSEPFAAVDGVSFDVRAAAALGLVGESGSGKTTAARAALRLIEPCAGRVLFDGRDVLAMPPASLRRLRREAQIVFQDSAGSLSPRMRVGDIVAEPLIVHGIARGAEARARAAELLDRCGMPADSASRYPHEFSGGQRQRIGIARAIALRPRLLVCDEPTSALDVSVQSQILNLLKDLQREFALGMLFISHDIAVVRHMCDEVAVMRGGRIVERGPCAEVIGAPREAYTQRLMAAVPGLDPRRPLALGAPA